jgi:hypothetical protein
MGPPEERLALHILNAFPIVKEHVERRAIFNTLQPGIEQVCHSDGRGADNHSSTHQMQVEFRIGEETYKPSSQYGEDFFPLTDPFFIFGQLFSVLASENS